MQQEQTRLNWLAELLQTVLQYSLATQPEMQRIRLVWSTCLKYRTLCDLFSGLTCLYLCFFYHLFNQNVKFLILCPAPELPKKIHASKWRICSVRNVSNARQSCCKPRVLTPEPVCFLQLIWAQKSYSMFQWYMQYSMDRCQLWSQDDFWLILTEDRM